MNILFISKYAVNPHYGVPSRQFFLSKFLGGLDRNKVLLVSSRSTMVDSIPRFRGISKQQSIEGVTNLIINGPVTGLGFSPKRVLSWFLFELGVLIHWNRFRKFKPDIIYVSSLSILSFLSGIVLKRIFKVPLVLEIRDIYPLTLIEVGGYSKKHPAVRFLGWVERIGYKKADLITSTLPQASKHVFSIADSSKPFAWIPMGYDPDFYSEEARPVGIQESVKRIQEFPFDFKIGYSGTLGKANALTELFQAMDSLVGVHESIGLVVIGDGPLASEFESSYGKLPNILFLGKQPKKYLPSLLGHCDLLVNPWLDRDLYRFGISPNKWIDYMLSGRPILCPYDGYRFILEDENIGWFCKPENADILQAEILRISQLPESTLDYMGANGKQFVVKNLSYEHLATRLMKALSDVSKNS